MKNLKERAIKYLEENGPSIPVRLSKELGVDPIWAGAILSELIQMHQIKLSSMKVGSTPIYYLDGQEEQLEKFADEHLKDTPKQAYLLLKKELTLDDATQEPQIRVALRSLRDFAIMSNENGRITWKYAFAKEKAPEPEEDKENIIEKPDEEVVEEDTIEPEKEIGDEEETRAEETKEVENIFEEEPEKEDLLTRVKGALEELNIKLLEETDVKKREFMGLGRMQGLLGETEILIIAKDKKSINDKDLEKIFQEITEQKKQVLLLTTGELAKKSIEAYRNYKNIIKIKQI